MDYEALQAAIVAWLAALTGLDANVIVWEDDPRPMTDGVVVLLAWLDEPGVGVDETRYEDDESPAPANNLTPVVVGARTLTLQIGYETFRQDPAGIGHARKLASLARKRLFRPSALAALAAVNLGLIAMGSATRADYRNDQGRWIARVVAEVRFNATTCDVDTVDATSSIETVELHSTFVTSVGDAEAASLQIASEVP